MNADGRFEAVETGWPLTQLLACTTCGVLLWDVDKHYRSAHGIRCVVDECPAGPFASVAELNEHSREHHVETWYVNGENIGERYPGANKAGDFTWHTK
ncbi:hypothetical protein A5625_08070 [Mycobacterium sp. 1465703.0]|nr:hypothetical protein A5625_08070 [Mycobacterium sp. 1465703.0]